MTPKVLSTMAALLIGMLSAQSLGAQKPAVAKLTPAERKAGLAVSSANAITRVTSLLASGDTAAALDLLTKATDADPENGILWFKYADVYAEKSRPGWNKVPMPGYSAQYALHAQDGYEKAMRLSPDSVRFGIAYAAYMWSSRGRYINFARGISESEMKRAQENGDPVFLGMLANQLGMMLWTGYERTIWTVRRPTDQESADMVNREGLKSEGMLRYAQRNPNSSASSPLFATIAKYFHDAAVTFPDSEKYFRHEAMLLASFSRWPEAKDLAMRRMANRPREAWPWLVLGLSEHWMGKEVAAQVAFDSGFTRLPARDQARLASISRLLARNKIRWYDTLPVATKNELHEAYWNAANPSMLLGYNPRLVEFRARIVYSELRFGGENEKKNGADTDKGEVYMRYGPPDYWFGSNVWLYARDLVHFVFFQGRGADYAEFVGESAGEFERYRYEVGNAWGNSDVLRNRIDSVSSQVVRFRSAPDSMDVAIFAGIRPGTLRRGTPVDTSRIMHGVFFVDAHGREISHATGSINSGETDTVTMIPQNYYLRTAATANAVRIEALEPDLKQAARTIADISKFETRNFGISDLLIAASVVEPVNKPAARWSDYKIAALTGNLVLRGAPLSLLWETYEPGSTNGSAHLRYAVTVQRETNSGLVALAARVIGGAREALGGSSRDSRQLTITYDRELTAAPVVVDNLKLDIGRLEPGRYRVSLAVTDLSRNVTISRMQRFSVLR